MGKHICMHINHLFKNYFIYTQKELVRIMTFKSYLEHTEAIFRSSQILNIFNINEYLRFIHVQIYPLYSKIIFMSEYNTSSAALLHKSCTLYQNIYTLANKGIATWNKSKCKNKSYSTTLVVCLPSRLLVLVNIKTTNNTT